MIREPLPLTSGDLRAVAEALDEIEATQLAGSKIIGRIEILRPDADDPDRIGWAARFDESDPDLGWGFVAETP